MGRNGEGRAAPKVSRARVVNAGRDCYSLAMPSGIPHRGRSSTLTRAGALLGLLIYLLPLAAALPRSARGGAIDRTPGIVLARYRPAQADVAADDRPLPPPSTPALTPACRPAVLAPDPTGWSSVDPRDVVASLSLPGFLSRSPPVS